jgi:homoserine O-acetyltransferase
MKAFIFLLPALLVYSFGYTQTKFPSGVESEFVIKDFRFQSNETLPQLIIHYTSVGHPVKDKNGRVANAVLIMHGTTGDAHQFLSDLFAGHLFNHGQLLDASKYYIIIPDAIGHGKSSKPSNGLHMKFPKYTYDDMVKADYQLLIMHLGIEHMRLIMGTSMGGMETWVFGYTYPNFMDALMPLASLPVEIAGRNRMMRKMAMNLIEMDPEWKGGEYTSEPKVGLTGAISSLVFMTSIPLQWQKRAPNRMKADSMLDAIEKRYFNSLDANDMIYQLDASREYNPSPHLSKIVAPLFAVNSADDQVNPPELNLMETELKKVKKGKYILLPITDKTSGHGTHTNPEVWGNYLKELLDQTNKQ